MPPHDDALNRLANEMRAMRSEIAENSADTRLIKHEILGELGTDRPGMRTRMERVEHRVNGIESTHRQAKSLIRTAIGSGLAAVGSALWVFLTTGRHPTQGP